MNTEFLKDMYDVVKDGGYPDDFNSFVERIQSDIEFQNDLFSTVKEGGYPDGINDFKTLIGVKSNESSSEQFTDGIQREPKIFKDDNSLFRSEDGLPKVKEVYATELKPGSKAALGIAAYTRQLATPEQMEKEIESARIEAGYESQPLVARGAERLLLPMLSEGWSRGEASGPLRTAGDIAIAGTSLIPGVAPARAAGTTANVGRGAFSTFKTLPTLTKGGSELAKRYAPTIGTEAAKGIVVEGIASGIDEREFSPLNVGLSTGLGTVAQGVAAGARGKLASEIEKGLSEVTGAETKISKELFDRMSKASTSTRSTLGEGTTGPELASLIDDELGKLKSTLKLDNEKFVIDIDAADLLEKRVKDRISDQVKRGLTAFSDGKQMKEDTRGAIGYALMGGLDESLGKSAMQTPAYTEEFIKNIPKMKSQKYSEILPLISEEFKPAVLSSKQVPEALRNRYQELESIKNLPALLSPGENVTVRGINIPGTSNLPLKAAKVVKQAQYRLPALLGQEQQAQMIGQGGSMPIKIVPVIKRWNSVEEME